LAEDGSVNIWNTELALFRVAKSDFKATFIKPSEDELKGGVGKKKKEDDSAESDKPKIYKILANALSDKTKNVQKPYSLLEKKPMPKSTTELQPNEVFVEQLMQMGFSE